MADTTKNSGEKLSVASTKTLTLKRGGVEQGVVRQSFSHGRSKAVVVEKVKRRVAGPGEAKAEPAVSPERTAPKRAGAAAKTSAAKASAAKASAAAAVPTAATAAPKSSVSCCARSPRTNATRALTPLPTRGCAKPKNASAPRKKPACAAAAKKSISRRARRRGSTQAQRRVRRKHDEGNQTG